MNFVVNMFDRVIKYSCPQNSFVFTVAYKQSLGISSFVFVIVCACVFVTQSPRPQSSFIKPHRLSRFHGNQKMMRRLSGIILTAASLCDLWFTACINARLH